MISLDMNSVVIILVLLAIGLDVLIYFSWKKYIKASDTDEVTNADTETQEESEPLQ